MFTVAIGLGSNLGNRKENLRQAGEFLRKLLTGKVTFSPLYESEPVGYLEQPWFLNQACMGETRLPPLQLLFRLKEFERKMGREPGGPRFGPRGIDLDLLFYANWVFKSHLLTVPHPRMGERSFVLLPLVEMGTDWVHPELGLTIQEIWAAKKETLAPSVRLD
ncbi:MAG TPA: 2-amino-4-hydroxy-6-hydroxymethyldihydropteridine diphosphokinase [Firmicutes bacterium]|nr:2-amino-4-hydroxy-6-hydroxymethyldihydropteridine diphosphokinase [Bacillota bacterium]